MGETVRIDSDVLENLADYVADEIIVRGEPEMEYLEDDVREAYRVLGKD